MLGTNYCFRAIWFYKKFEINYWEGEYFNLTNKEIYFPIFISNII